MSKPLIAVRMPPSLLEKLNSHAKLTGTSKTDVILTAVAQYLDCLDSISLTQRVTELEIKVKELQARDSYCKSKHYSK